MFRTARYAALVTTALSLPLATAHADEGMWTFDAFPAARMKARLRLGARSGVARPGARGGGPPDWGLFGELRVGYRAHPHQPPLRRKLCGAELDC